MKTLHKPRTTFYDLLLKKEIKMICPYFCSLRTTEVVNIRFRQMIVNRVRSFQKILFTNESMCTNNII